MHNAIYCNFKDFTDSGELIAASPGMRIQVFGFIIVTNAAVTARFRSANNSISAGFPLAANGGIASGTGVHPWFETNPGEALNLLLSAPAVVGVQVAYNLAKSS